MNKNANAATKESSPKKSDKKASKLEKVNLDKVTAKVEANRESKYNYPESVKTAKDKKVFRRNARAARVKFMETLEKLKASNDKKAKIELKKIEGEFKAWEGSTYAVISK